MKKLFVIALSLIMILGAVSVFTSCNPAGKELVALDATDLLKEDFGIAVKKGNTELLKMVNEVVDEWVADGTMTKYIDYYDAIAKGEKADANGLQTSWDFGKATEVITVYTESGFAPFEFVVNGEVVGVDIAIMNEVAERNNMKVEVKDVLFDTITTCVKGHNGHAVGAAGLTINEERQKEVDFSNIYYSSTLVVVSAKDKSISSVKDLSGLTVGVQEGTSGDLIITAAAKDGYIYTDYDENDNEITKVVRVDAKTEIKQYKQYSLALADLKAGRIDAILMDKLPAQAMIAASED
ncbi:MAG: transporter substrate-binding domain-containing protein [Ruminococcaceae bacterium]|nr:transporter substrate-binding domain-containing protein [Oscillospiraceae bacterium]